MANELIDPTKEPDYSPKSTKKTLKDLGLKATEKFKVTNPVTGKQSLVVIERDGTTESKLALTIANPDVTKEQKEHAVSMYLYEKGQEGGSFLMDLYRSKGEHTKETRAFKTQMRHDFESFADSFVKYLQLQEESVSRNIFKTRKEYSDFKQDYFNFVDRHKGVPLSVFDYSDAKNLKYSGVECAVIEMAIKSGEEANNLVQMIEKTTEQRLQEKGYGIYIDPTGQIYSIYDEDVVDKVEADRIEALKKNKNGKQSK